jgi:hypothetical protein
MAHVFRNTDGWRDKMREILLMCKKIKYPQKILKGRLIRLDLPSSGWKGLDSVRRCWTFPVTLETEESNNIQLVNGLRKIAWASVFRLKRQHINIYSMSKPSERRDGSDQTDYISRQNRLNPFTDLLLHTGGFPRNSEPR